MGYAINDVLSQLISGTSLNMVVIKADLSLWHLIVFFFRKIFPIKTKYKTYDSKLLVIVKAFKVW